MKDFDYSYETQRRFRLVFFLYIGLFLIVFPLMFRFLFDDDWLTQNQAFMNFALYLLLMIVLIPFVKPQLKKDYNHYLACETPGKKLLFGYLMLLGGSVISVLWTSGFEFLGLIDGTAQNQLEIMAMLASEQKIFILISAILFAPLVEEIVFRKALMGLIPHPVYAIIGSSLMFAFMHVINETSGLMMLIQGMPYFISSAVFGFIYIKYQRNLVFPVLIHMMHNAIAIMTILLFN